VGEPLPITKVVFNALIFIIQKASKYTLSHKS